MLTRDEQVLFTIDYNCLKWKMRADVEGLEGKLEIQTTNRGGSGFTLTLGDKIAMKMRCTNMMHNILSSFKVTPPVWDVDVEEGMDLVLVRFFVRVDRMFRLIVLLGCCACAGCF